MDKTKLITKMGYWAGELDSHEDALMALKDFFDKTSPHYHPVGRALVSLVQARTSHILRSIECIRDKLCEELQDERREDEEE